MKIQRRLTRICTMTTFLLGSFLTSAGFGQTLVTNEYWISPSTNTSNLGTLDEPFNGSTESNFDYTLASLPQGSAIHIRAGTYQTLGNLGPFHLKSNDKIIGSGEDVTIIQLATNMQDNAFVMADGGQSGIGISTNITVENLTLDGNYRGGTSSIYGLNLDGPNMTAKDIKVIHLAYFDPNVGSESWAILILGPNALIEHCLVENFCGGVNNKTTTLAIANTTLGSNILYTGSGIIRDNTIIYTNNTGNCFGIGLEGNDILIQGNTIDGADVGVYNDTGDTTNITIADNIFKNGYSGIYFGTGNNIRQNYIISDNMFLMATNFGTIGARAINLGYGCTNWTITGNMVGWDYPPQPGELGYFLICATQEQGVLVANNRADPNLENFIVTNGYYAYGNYDLTGNWLTNLNQTPNIVDPAHGGLGTNASSWAAGLLPYTTGTGVFGSTPISSFGLGLIDSLNYSSALTALGLPGNPQNVVTNDANGNVSVSGTNYAAHFIGDGSGITNLSSYSADHDASDIMNPSGNLNQYAYPTGSGYEVTSIELFPGTWDLSMFQTPRIVSAVLANSSLTKFSTSWQIYVTNSVSFSTNWVTVEIQTNNPIGWYYSINALTQIVPVPGNLPCYIYTTNAFSVPYGILTNSTSILIGVFNDNSWNEFVTDVTLLN